MKTGRPSKNHGEMEALLQQSKAYELSLIGMTQVRIAEECGISQKQVSYSIEKEAARRANNPDAKTHAQLFYDFQQMIISKVMPEVLTPVKRPEFDYDDKRIKSKVEAYTSLVGARNQSAGVAMAAKQAQMKMMGFSGPDFQVNVQTNNSFVVESKDAFRDLVVLARGVESGELVFGHGESNLLDDLVVGDPDLPGLDQNVDTESE